MKFMFSRKCYNSFNSNYNVPEGVVPIGVVLDEVNRLAAALKDAPGTYTQVEAIDYCANDKTGGVTWMLPTKEELVLLFDKDNQFKKSSLYSILESSERYWSSTQKTSSQSWTVYRGTAGTRSKTYSCKSRCITSF